MAALHAWLKLLKFGQEVVEVMLAGLLVLNPCSKELHERRVALEGRGKGCGFQRSGALGQYRPEPAPPSGVFVADVDVLGPEDEIVQILRCQQEIQERTGRVRE
jgi:hypothetical protein